MSCCLKAGFSISGSYDIVNKNRGEGSFRVCSSIGSLQMDSNQILVKTLDHKFIPNLNVSPFLAPVNVEKGISIAKSQRWWEKSIVPNMVEIHSAQELVDALLNAGDRLIVVDFYAPGCGGCRTLHPKLCQLAGSNPNAMFLKVNQEQHKAMCYALNVHVLPFFKFFRGADGKVCSFSCTNATIKKFKDALSKHGNDRCSLGPPKGLDEKEISTLTEIGLLSRNVVHDELMYQMRRANQEML